ncbi:hypothetical protein ACFXK0_23515 [Nocardia sp. NPDC059177]|uniref:hypothetical protein n=1 Tax=Nocardia sp. NPDC059177 TaxID=3346759 RepID=UPI0036C7A4B6
MNDNDNRRPRRRAARSAGPPVEETAAETVTITKSETVSPEPDADATVRLAATAVVDNTDKRAERSTDDTAQPTDDTVRPTAHEAPVDLAKPADTEAATSRGSGGCILALAAAIVLVLALVAGAGFAAFTAYSGAKDEDLRAQYTETARQAVLNLTTIRADTAKEDIDRILSVASGDFKTEFDGRVDPFMEVVKQANVVSTGEVVESGVVTADDQSAQVLVAAKQTVSNNGSPEPQSRQYRFRVTVSNADSGMTVSKVEFVG